MNSPFTFCTVMRVGGVSWRRLRVGGAFQIESARAESSAVARRGGLGRRALSRPSSSTSAVIVTGLPTVVSRSVGPSRVIVGGSLPRVSALLCPAPSAPVSDMKTMLSTM